ncbi:hypothetical protein ACC771_08535, partial [Rhizobium ruizarguesonis]
LAGRILAWLTEKFTRNFSAGKDFQRLPKISSSGLIFGHSLHQNADFLANPAANIEVEGRATPTRISRRIVRAEPLSMRLSDRPPAFLHLHLPVADAPAGLCRFPGDRAASVDDRLQEAAGGR